MSEQNSPLKAVWEITMACNMRCKHCGSSCKEPLPGELSTEEALHLCDDLSRLGLNHMTLSGGEPLLRKDWFLLARRLKDLGVEVVNMITNGWLLNDAAIDRALEVGLAYFGISIDGLEETHDHIRCNGAFSHAMNALERLKQRGFPGSVITTVMKPNIGQLPEMQKVFEEKGVQNWQLQFGLPVGNLSKWRHYVIDPSQVKEIMDFMIHLQESSPVKPCITDCLGYWTAKSIQLLQLRPGAENACWQGCQAGKRVMGILHDGSITGCTAVRDKKFVEGNVRETPLREIWTRPGAFAWNRNRSRQDLGGFCRLCRFADLCLGGCTNVRLTMTDTADQNPYCAYRLSVEQLIPKIKRIREMGTLMKRAETAIELELYDMAVLIFQHGLSLEPDHLDVLKQLGFLYWKLGDYGKSQECNEKIIAMAPSDVSALKGLGVCLANQGQLDKGIMCLKQSIALADHVFLDAYHDLAAVLVNHGRAEEALNVLEEGRRRSPEFRETSQELYARCLAP